MAMLLRQNTAVSFKLGPFVSDADGFTPMAALAIAQADVRLSKNGGDFAQKNDAGGGVVDENGWYDVPVNATDTGTCGRLQVACFMAGALPVWVEFEVLPANLYDSLTGARTLPGVM